MSSGRKSYDPSQFLHYPENNPFSDVAQKKLNTLIEDFLRTGVVFANGACARPGHVQTQGPIQEKTSIVPNGNFTQLDLKNEASEIQSCSDESSEVNSEERYILRPDKGKGREIIHENAHTGKLSLHKNSGDELDVDEIYEEEEAELVEDNLAEYEDAAYDSEEGFIGVEERFGAYDVEDMDDHTLEEYYGFDGAGNIDAEYGDEGYDNEMEEDRYTQSAIVNPRLLYPHDPSSSEQERIEISDDDGDDED